MWAYDLGGRMTGKLESAGRDGGKMYYRMTSYAYDGNRTRETRHGGMPEVAVTEYGRDADGNVTCILTPEGYRIRREYERTRQACPGAGGG